MKDFFKRWWFWAIILLVIILIELNIEFFKNTKTNTADTETVATVTQKKENENNMYTVIKDYDGIYAFTLNGNDGTNGKGVIKLENGICEAQYLITNNGTITETVERDGYCGLEDSTYYILFKLDENYGLIKYECSKTEEGMSCKLFNKYDLIGQSNSNLNLQRLDTNKDLNDVFKEIKTEIEREEKARKEQEEKKRKAAEEENFKESCKTYTYEQIARNPEKFKGTNIKLTGEVIQALYSSSAVDLRVNITKQGTYSTYYTDTVYVVYYPESGEDKILEDDIITIYGTAQGDYTYTSAIGAPVTLPLIYGRYIEIN